MAHEHAEPAQVGQGALRRHGQVLRRGALARAELPRRAGPVPAAILQINDLLRAYAEAKTHCPDPIDPRPEAAGHAERAVENITSNDPNEIYGPKGAGAEGWIPRSMALGYSIRFENLGPGSTIPPGQQPASAPATVVKVVTDLSPAIDIDRSRSAASAGARSSSPSRPGGRRTTPTVPHRRRRLRARRRRAQPGRAPITWTLTTIDPATGEIDGSPTAGFLPPEDGKGTRPGPRRLPGGHRRAVAQGAAINAKATITFDVNAPIQTNTHTNTVDGVAPASTLTLGTPSCDGRLPVAWTGTDTGSGVAAYDVEVSADGAKTWSPWLRRRVGDCPGRTRACRARRTRSGCWRATPPATRRPRPPRADATKTLGACDLAPPRTT